MPPPKEDPTPSKVKPLERQTPSLPPDPLPALCGQTDAPQPRLRAVFNPRGRNFDVTVAGCDVTACALSSRVSCSISQDPVYYAIHNKLNLF